MGCTSKPAPLRWEEPAGTGGRSNISKNKDYIITGTINSNLNQFLEAFTFYILYFNLVSKDFYDFNNFKIKGAKKK